MAVCSRSIRADGRETAFTVAQRVPDRGPQCFSRSASRHHSAPRAEWLTQKAASVHHAPYGGRLCAGERVSASTGKFVLALSQTEWFSRVHTYPADGCGDTVVPSGVPVAPLERAASIQIPMASRNEYAYRSPPALVRSSSAPAPRLSCPHNPASALAWGSRRRSRRIEYRQCAGLYAMSSEDKQTILTSALFSLTTLEEKTAESLSTLAFSPCFSSNWRSIIVVTSSN